MFLSKYHFFFSVISFVDLLTSHKTVINFCQTNRDCFHTIKQNLKFEGDFLADFRTKSENIISDLERSKKKQKKLLQDNIAEIWIRDFGYLQGKRYKQVFEPKLAELTATTVTLFDGQRFRKIPRNYVIFVPKLETVPSLSQ